MSGTLILIEYDERGIKSPSLSAITFARELGGEYALLVIGHDVDLIAASVCCYGAAQVYTADSALLAHALADRWAHVIVQVAVTWNISVIAATASTLTKDILPRVAALLDRPMLTDVISIGHNGEDVQFRRPVYAGALVATMNLDSREAVFTIRPAGFAKPESHAGHPSPIVRVQVDTAGMPAGSQFVSAECRVSDRPDLTEARVVVSGGRPLNDADTFERIIGSLADILQGAVGSTRAAVDAGIVPNDLQIGQTGKVVSPELYIAAGVSGAIQHLAGVKDARVIVAINKDPDAPIFQSATYGLVGDLYRIVPELTEAIRKI